MSGRNTARPSSTPTRTSASIAAAYIAQIDAAKLFDGPVQTTLEPLEAFYEAEDYHHDYAARNPQQPYIRAVAAPKVKKLREVHRNLLKAG